MALKGQSIILQVDDMDKTIQYYGDILGFKCTSRMDNEWSKVERDDISIMFSCRYGDDKDGPTNMTASIYLFTNSVDELWEEFNDKTQVIYPIETFDYGMREFAILDCNGYMLQFGQEVE